MIKALLIDDEQAARSALTELIEIHCPQLKIAGTATSVGEAIMAIEALQPDVLFLDIEMPEQNGFNLLENYDEYPFAVIFTTAYDAYAIKAIRFSALDYLLKPIQKEELLQAVQRMLKSKNSNERLQNLKEHNSDLSSRTIMLNSQGGFEKVRLETIVRFEAQRNYTFVFFANRQKQLMCFSLRHFEDLLEGNEFIRIHRSHLVNKAFIAKVNKGKQWSIVLSNQETLPIAHRKKSYIMEELKK